MCAHHFLVGGLEVAVLAGEVPPHTLLGNMLLHLVLGDGLLAVEGTLGVHILAVVLVRAQVSLQLFQWPRPGTSPLLQAAVNLEIVDLSLVLH